MDSRAELASAMKNDVKNEMENEIADDSADASAGVRRMRERPIRYHFTFARAR
jgi:hypothetical protein